MKMYRNDSKALQKAFFGAQVMGLCAWSLYLIVVGAMTYLAIWPPATLRNVFT